MKRGRDNNNKNFKISVLIFSFNRRNVCSFIILKAQYYIYNMMLSK